MALRRLRYHQWAHEAVYNNKYQISRASRIEKGFYYLPSQFVYEVKNELYHLTKIYNAFNIAICFFMFLPMQFSRVAFAISYLIRQ